MIPFLILGPVAIAGQPPDGPMTDTAASAPS